MIWEECVDWGVGGGRGGERGDSLVGCGSGDTFAGSGRRSFFSSVSAVG